MWIHLNLFDWDSDFNTTVIDPNGRPVNEDVLFGGTVLNVSGDYSVYISSATGADYALTIGIENQVVEPIQPVDPDFGKLRFERINFAPGATSTSINSSVSANGSVIYTLNAMAGQQMDVSISGSHDVEVKVRGPQLVLVDSRQRSWSAILPETGTYEIAVNDISGPFDSGFDKGYSLYVSIVTPAPEPVLHQVERINFQPGATSAVRSGIISMNGSITYYLQASAGQWMDVSVTDFDAQNVAMDVYSPSGDYLFSFEPRTWSGTLPESGDYQVRVYSTLGAFGKNFNLNVSIAH